MTATHQWNPYPWEPVLWPTTDFRVTFGYSGHIEAMRALIDGQEFPFSLADSAAELVIPAVDLAGVPDRSPVEIHVLTGGAWHILCAGNLVRRKP